MGRCRRRREGRGNDGRCCEEERTRDLPSRSKACYSERENILRQAPDTADPNTTTGDPTALSTDFTCSVVQLPLHSAAKFRHIRLDRPVRRIPDRSAASVTNRSKRTRFHTKPQCCGHTWRKRVPGDELHWSQHDGRLPQRPGRSCTWYNGMA